MSSSTFLYPITLGAIIVPFRVRLLSVPCIYYPPSDLRECIPRDRSSLCMIANDCHSSSSVRGRCADAAWLDYLGLRRGDYVRNSRQLQPTHTAGDEIAPSFPIPALVLRF
eukprot:6204925-Pleurochrysis_carterae.AAC.1